MKPRKIYHARMNRMNLRMTAETTPILGGQGPKSGRLDFQTGSPPFPAVGSRNPFVQRQVMRMMGAKVVVRDAQMAHLEGVD